MRQHNDLVEGFIHTQFIYNYCIALQVLCIGKKATYHAIRQYVVVSSIRKLKYCSVNTSTQKRLQPTKIFLFLSSMLKWLVSNACFVMPSYFFFYTLRSSDDKLHAQIGTMLTLLHAQEEFRLYL